MGCTEASLACISELPVGWTQQYIFWSMNRSLQHIFQYLENARSSLLKLYLSKHQDMLSSTSSIIVAQEAVLPCCVCKKAKHTDLDISSGSSRDISSLSQLPVFSEGTTWKLQSQSLTTLQRKQNSRVRNQLSSLYSFNCPEIRNSKALQKLEILPLIRTQGTFIKSSTEHSEICKQRKKAKIKRKIKRYVTADRPYSTFKKAPVAPASTRISPLSRWELEGHMAWKVCTLREQRVPLPVRDSWIAMNYIIEAQEGIPKPEKPQIHSSRSKYQSYEKNVKKKSPDLASVLIQVNTKVESELNKTETKISQSLTPGKQSPKGDTQILGYRPSVKSMNIAPAKSLVADQNQEATTFLQKDPKHLLELRLKQRVTGFPEKTQHHKIQATKVELIPKLPYQFTDNVKVTPQELHQVMDSMGMIPESHSEEIGSTDLFPQSPNEAGKPVETIKTASIRHKLFQNTKSVDVTPESKYHNIDSDRPSKPVTHTDNPRVTPVELLQVMDTMGMIKKPHPNIDSMTVMPRPQYKVMEAVKMNMQFNDQIEQPEKKSSRLQHLITKKVEMSPRLQNKIIESVDLTSRPQNKAMKSNITIPEPFYQNKESPAMVSRSLPQVMKITPVALLQTMDFMGIIPPAQQHVGKCRKLTSDSVPPISNLRLRTTQSDSLITSTSGPKSPPRVIQSGGMIPKSSYQSVHSPMASPLMLRSPVDMTTIPQLQDNETKTLTLTPTSQDKISLDFTSGSRIQELGLEGITPQLSHKGRDPMVLNPRSSHQDTETSSLTSKYQIPEDSEMNPPKSDQVTVELTPETCAKRKEVTELTQPPHKIMESSGTVTKPPGQGIKFTGINQKSPHQVTESASKTTILQNVKPVQNHKVMEHTKLPPDLQNVKYEKMSLEVGLQSIKPIDKITGPIPQTVKYRQQIPTVNSTDLASELHLSSVEYADLAPVSQSQSDKSMQLAPGSQLQDVKPTSLSPGPQEESVKLAELAPVPHLQSNTDLTPSSQLKSIEYLNLSVPSVFPDIKTTELTKKPPQGDTKLKLVESSPKSSLQDSTMPKDVKRPQMTGHKGLILETQKQEKKYEELVPGTNAQTIKSVELKPKATEPERLTPGHQASESSGMFSESKYQDIKPKFTFDTCHETKESVGLLQSPLRDIPGPLNQASEFVSMNSESSQNIPDMMLQSMNVMGDTPVSQYTTQTSLKLVPISEMQGAKSEVLIPELPGMQSVHPYLEPKHSEVISSEDLVSESEFQNVKSMSLVSKLQSKSIKPEDMTLASLKHDNTCVDLTAPLEESRGLIPEKESLNIELRKLTTEPQLQAIHSMDLSYRPSYQEITFAELASEVWPQKDKSVNTQQVTETAGMLPQSQFQFFSKSTKGSSNKERETVRMTTETSIQKPAGPVLESTKIVSRPYLQVTESTETHLEVECENTEAVGLASFTVESTQKTLTIPSYSEKESLKLETQHENSVPTAQDLKFRKLTYETSPLVAGTTQFITGPQPNVTELTQGPQFQAVKTRQIDPELQLEDVKFVDLIRQPDSRVVDSETMIQKPTLQNKTLEELTKEAQQQGMKLTRGPSLQSVRFSVLSPNLFLQGEKPADFISGSPYQNVQSDELTLGYPMQEIKLPDQEYQSVTSARLSSEPHQEKNFVELTSGPCLQNVRFSDLTPEPKHKEKIDAHSIAEKPFQVTGSITFITKPSLQPNQRTPVGGMKSSWSFEGPPSHSTKSIKVISQQQGVKPEEVYLRPRQEDVKFSKLTSGPKLQGVKFREGTPESVFRDINSVDVTTEIGVQDSKLVMIPAGLQINKQVGFNTRPWLQDVKFCDQTSGTQPQVIKSSTFNLMPQLQCVKLPESTSEPKAQGVRPMKSTSGPKQQGASPDMLVSEPLFQGIKYTENQISSFKNNTSYKLASESSVPDVKSMDFTPAPKLPNVNHCELTRRSQLQGFESSELNQRPQMQDIKPMGWMSVSEPQGLKPDLTTESQNGSEKSVTVTLRHYLRGLKSLLNQSSQLESKKSMETVSGPQKGDTKSIKVTSDSKLHYVKLDERVKLQSRTQETLKLAPRIQLHDMKSVEQDIKLKHGPKMQGQDSLLFASEPLFQEPQMQAGKLGELTSESQIPEKKSADIASCVNLQRDKSIKAPDSVVQSNSELKSVKLTSKLKRQNAIRKQMHSGIKDKDFSPVQQFQEKTLVNLTPEPEKDVEPSAVSPVQQHVLSEQLKKCSKSLKDDVCLGLIHHPTFKGRDVVSHNLQLQMKGKKSLEPTPELNMECVQLKEVKFEPQLQSIKPPKLTQGPQLPQVEPISQPPFQGRVTLESEKEPPLENMKCAQWILQSEFQGGDSVALNLGSQSQGVKSVESKPLIWLRDMKSPKLTLESKIQDTTCMGPQFQTVKTPKLFPGQQLQERKLLVSSSEPPLKGVKTVDLSTELQLGSMNSSKWIPLAEFQDIISQLNIEPQSQCIKPTELKHLIQLRNMKSSVLTPRPKLQDTQSSASLQEKPGVKLKSTQSCDLRSKSKPHDIQSIMLQPRIPLHDRKSLELTMKPQLQEVKPLQFHPGIQLQAVKTPKSLPINSAISNIQKNLASVKSEVSSEPQWEGLQSSKLPLETKCQDKKFTELEPSSHMQAIPFSKVATGIKSPVVNSTDLNVGLLLQSVKTAVGTSRTNIQDEKQKGCKPHIQSQVMTSSGLIPGLKIKNVKSIVNLEAQLQGLKSKLISDTTFLDAASGKLKSMPQWQGEKSGMMMGSELQKVKLVDCKSSPQLQDMSFPRLIAGLKVHNIKSLKCTVDPQVKVVKPSEVIPVENLQGVKSIELNPHPKLQGEKSSESALGRKFSGVKYVESHLAPQLKNRSCSDLIMGIKLKNIESVGFSSILQFQGMKSSAVVPGTKIQAEKSMFNSGAQMQSKNITQLMKLQRKNSTKVNHEPEFQVGKSTKLSLGPRIHSVMCSESRAEKQGQVKESSKLSPWPELQGVKFMAFNRELQLQHINSSELCKKTIHQDMKSIKLHHEQKFQNGEYSELLLKPKFQEERFSVLNPGLSTKNDLHTQTKCPVEQFLEHKHESKFQGRKSSELNPESQGIDVMAHNNGPLSQGVKLKLTARPHHQGLTSKMSVPGSHLQGANSSILIPESKPQCVNSIECHPRPNMQGLNASETETPVSKLQSMKSSELNPSQSETSMVFNLGSYFPDLKSQLILESKHLGVTPRKCSPGPLMQCANSPEMNPRPKSDDVNSMKWEYSAPVQNRKSFELTSGTKLQDKGCEVNLGTEIHNEKSMMSDLGPHLKSQLTSESKPASTAPRKCNPGTQKQCINSPEFLPGTKLQCINSTGYRHVSPSQSIKCPELTSGTKLQDKGCEVNLGTEIQSEKSMVSDPGPHLQGLKSQLISESKHLGIQPGNCNPGPERQCANSPELLPGTNLQCLNSTGCRQGPLSQSVKYSELTSGTKLQDTAFKENPGTETESQTSMKFNTEPHLQDLKPEFIPNSTFLHVTTNGYNLEPQMQYVNFSKLSPGPKVHCANDIGCKYGPPLQSIKFSELALGTKCRDMRSSDLKTKLEYQRIKSTVNQNLQKINCIQTPGKKFQALMESNSGSQYQGMNSCNSNSGSGYQSNINSIKINPESLMQDMKSYDLNPGSEFQGTTSILSNSKPHLQGVKSSELTSCTKFPENQLLENHLGSQQQVMQPVSVPTSGHELNNVKYGEFLPELSLEDVKFVKMKREALHHGINSVQLNSDSERQDKKCQVSSLEPCFQKVQSVELNLQPHSQSINSEELLPALRQHNVKSMVHALEQSFHEKSLELKAGLQPKDSNSKNSYFRQKSTVLRSEPGSQNMKSLKSNLWSQPQSSLGFTSCLIPKCVKSDNSVLEPCFQDVKSVQLMPAVQQQGINCQELTSGQQGVKSTVVLAQESSKKFIPGPILTSVKISNLSLESQQQDMTSLELTSHPKLHDIKCMKFPLVLQQKIPTGPLLQSVKSENLVPRMNNKMTDFSEVSPRSGHQSVENAEMTPKSSHQSSQSVNLLLPTYQHAESSKMPHNLAHQSVKTVKKSVDLTPKLMESSGMPLDRDFNGLESADLTSSLRAYGSHFSELTPEKSYQISENLSISQSGSKIKELGAFHIRQLRQNVAPEEIIPELKHHVTETMKLISEVRSQREEISGIMPETKSVSKATGYENKSSNSYPQTLEPVEIIPEKRPCGQEYVALITSDHFTEPLEMTLDEFVELISETGLQAEGSIKLTGIPQQNVEYARLEHQVPESEHLTSKQCSQRKESLQLPLKETGQCEKHVNFVKKTSDTWQKGERSTWQTQIDKKSMNYSEMVPEKLGQKSLDQIRQKTQLQAAQTQGATSVVTSKLESVAGNPGRPIQVKKSVTLPPWTTSQMVDYTETTPQQQDRRLSEFISGLWFQSKKSNKSITEPTHQIVEIIDMMGFQIVKTILFPGPPFQIIKSEKLAPGPIPQVLEPIGISLVLGRNNMNYFDLLTMTNFQEWAEPVKLSARSNNEIKSAESSSKAASPFVGLTELTHEEKLLALKSLSEKTVPFQVTESEDFILEQLCLNRGSEELKSGVELQKEKYFPKFPCNSSKSLMSSTVKTSSELGCFWDREMPEELKTMGTKYSATHFLQSEEFFDQSMRPFSTQPPLNIVNTVQNTHSEVLGKDILSKERTMLGQVEELKKSSQSLSQHFPQCSRSSSKTFQKRPGARGSLPCFVLRRQQNVWESHSWKQRLPRKYLSSMLVLGNVLQTNMERKLCSQTDLTEGANTHQSTQNVFGVPPELIKFSQSLPKKGRSAISPPAMGKNYIQRHTLHYGNNEKRMTLRMWTRRSMSSMMQQYSAARMKIKKISPNLSDKVQEFIHCMPISYNTESQLPFPGKYPLNKHLAESPFPVEESENSYTHTDFQHSYKPSYTSQTKTIFSEQFQLLQELQLKIAAKLLRSQVPPNVPPPLSSGLVLKYPICLKCGRCAGFDCCHQAQTSSGPYLLIYPQLHLVSTSEGHGEIRLHLGFRLRTGKRPQIPKYYRRDRPVKPKNFQSLSRRKPKIHTQVSTSTLDLESGSTQSPLQYHIRQRLYNSRDLVGKREAGKSSHCEVTQVHSLPDTDSESNEDEKWANVRRKKSNYLKNRTTKVVRTPSTKFYMNGRNTTQSQLRELPVQPEGKNNGTSQMMTISLERQPKKSCQPKFIQLLSQSIKQAFQRAHNIIAFAAHKFEERTRSDYVCEDKDNHPEQKDISSSKDRMSVVNLNPIDTITKQKSPSEDTTDQFISSQQPKTVQSFQSKVTHLLKPKVSQESSTYYSRRIIQHQGVVKKDSNTRVKENYRNETSSNESRNSKVGNTVQGQETEEHCDSKKETSSIHPKMKYTHKDESHTNDKERSLCHASERSQYTSSEKSYFSQSQISLSLSKSHPSDSKRSHPCPSERRCRISSERRFCSISKRSHPPLSERSHPTLSEIRHPPLSERSHPFLSKRSHPPLSERSHPFLSKRSHPPLSERSHPFLSKRSHPPLSERSNLPLSDRSHPPFSERSHPPLSERSHPLLSDRSHPPLSNRSHPALSEQSHSALSGRSHPPLSERGHLFLSKRSHPPLSERGHPPLSDRSHPPLSNRSHPALSERSHLPLSERGHPFLSERSHLPLSDRSHPPLSERSHLPLSERGHPPLSERGRPPLSDRSHPPFSQSTHPPLSKISHPSLSERSHPHHSEMKSHRPFDKSHHSPLEKTSFSSKRSHRSPTKKTRPRPKRRTHSGHHRSSERRHGTSVRRARSLSERPFRSHSESQHESPERRHHTSVRRVPSHSGRSRSSPSESEHRPPKRRHRPSVRRAPIRSDKSSRSPSDSEHRPPERKHRPRVRRAARHSERTRSSYSEGDPRPHPKALKHRPPREGPKHSFTKRHS